jgi:5-methyltetrahydropteroyltriglutamate--homocysteine methyltransferase
VLAGADCGFGTAANATPMVAPSVVWAKFESLAAGAEIATRRLWGQRRG